MKKITFVIPSRNNLELLKLAYQSIRLLKTTHDILVLNDASEDGTEEWLDSLNDEDIITYTNPGPDRVGIVGMFDKGIEMARTDIIFAFHADMVAGSNLDVNILKHLDKGKVISATRIEPPLHPPGPEKIIENFGIEPEEFDWTSWIHRNKSFEKDKTTNGIFAPWCMYKDEFLLIGGHDELFAPQSREDSDLFNRFTLNGYELIQSWDALVYHFTSRGSRFNKHAGGDTGKDSPEWQQTNSKNVRNFVRKWGTNVKHDDYMMPIIMPKYDIGFIVKNCNYQLLHILEPWCSKIYHDLGFKEELKYIKEEQPNSLIDIDSRVLTIQCEKNNDILVEFDGSKLTNENFNFLTALPDILQDSGESGNFELDIFKITISSLQNYEMELIKCDV
jgi:glycosyltransferase involved in cell wall biosynthesis